MEKRHYVNPLIKMQMQIRNEELAVSANNTSLNTTQNTNSLVPNSNTTFTQTQKTSNTSMSLYQKCLQRDEFKLPKTKEIILDEDEYLSCLEEIIQREYFPELYKINQEKQINKRVDEAKSVTENHNITQMTDNELRKINLEYEGEKAIEDKSKNKGKIKGNISDISRISPELSRLNKNKLANKSVDSFCMKYSSDELESLKNILHNDRKKKLSKYFWIYEQEFKANEKLKEIKSYTDKFKSLPQGDSRGKHFEIPNIITADSDAKSSLFFPPELSNTNNRMELMSDSCQSDSTNKNKLIASKGESSSGIYSANILNDMNKKTLKENTRLPENFAESIAEEHSHDVKKKILEAYENSDVVKLIREMDKIENKDGNDTPMVNGYKLVKPPKFNDKVPIFTWGEIGSTPNIIKENKFSVPATPEREDIAHSLANKNRSNILLTKRRRHDEAVEPAGKSVKRIPSSFKKYELTPNAMKLLDSVKSTTRINPARNSGIFDAVEKTPLINKGKDSGSVKPTPGSICRIKSIKK